MLGSHSPLAGAAALTNIPMFVMRQPHEAVWRCSTRMQYTHAVHAGDEHFFADSIKVN